MGISPAAVTGIVASNEAQGDGTLFFDILDGESVLFVHGESRKAYAVALAKREGSLTAISGPAYTAREQARQAGLTGVPATVDGHANITSGGYPIGAVRAWNGMTRLGEFNSANPQAELVFSPQGSNRVKMTPHLRGAVTYLQSDRSTEEVKALFAYLSTVFSTSVQVAEDGSLEAVPGNPLGEGAILKMEAALNAPKSDTADVQAEAPAAPARKKRASRAKAKKVSAGALEADSDL